MSKAVVSDAVTEAPSEERMTAELEAYNRAFLELELSWRWDARTFRDLLRIAADRDFVGAYIEQEQPHLLRVYEKSFLRDLVLSAKDRYQREC
ncbi:MAG: LysR family transcriptional regulator [Steroidobacteraceae bacterium]